MEIKYRDEEAVYVKPEVDRCTVVFSINFRDKARPAFPSSFDLFHLASIVECVPMFRYPASGKRHQSRSENFELPSPWTRCTLYQSWCPVRHHICRAPYVLM